ncbi:MAG: preprotein translocase subunit YajC [bacterium]
MNLLHVFLFSAPTEGQSGNNLYPLLMFVLIFVVFYFFMIRPQVKKQKELKNFREALKKGDKVITTGGIYGKIADIKDNHILIEVDNDIKLRVDKNAILKDPSDIQQQR